MPNEIPLAYRLGTIKKKSYFFRIYCESELQITTCKKYNFNLLFWFCYLNFIYQNLTISSSCTVLVNYFEEKYISIYTEANVLNKNIQNNVGSPIISIVLITTRPTARTSHIHFEKQYSVLAEYTRNLFAKLLFNQYHNLIWNLIKD